MSRAIAGDEVRLLAGAYTGATTLVLPSGVSLNGEVGATLSCTAGRPAVSIRGDHCRVNHLTIVAAVPEQNLIEMCGVDCEVTDCVLQGAGVARSAIHVSASSRVRVARCVISSCAVEIAGAAGVVIESSECVVEDCEVFDGRRGIVVARLEESPEVASDVVVTGNRCHDNRQAGIAFLSSTGRVEGNECWGSREGAGIVVQRDPESVEAASDVVVTGNRCHDNRRAGIAFLSSTGHVKGNECWGNSEGVGIAVQPDCERVEAASDVMVTGNRCHDNRRAGIAFLSSTGHVKGNECWGSREGSGIVVQRDAESVEVASDVMVTGNRCHDNQQAGIAFFSSTGQVEGNECWGNREGSGIVVRRDPKSVEAASDVVVTGNRCHGNRRAGIAFFSSTGQVEGNECWGSREGSGIAVQRGRESVEAASDVVVTGNRCHDNQQAGIAFLSSTGHVKGNECWGSRDGAGIVVQRDPESVEAASDVMVTGNRCHGNRREGIAFFSSTGQVEGNECWGSRDGAGIVVQRDPESVEAASDVMVTGNRCHDNQQAGIVFFSSTGQVKGNECWGSREGSGIVVQRDPESVEAASDVMVTGNRCHDNRQAGIAFLSSTGHVKGNECWGSREGSGIVVQRDPESVEAASDVMVTGNRCHGNRWEGIAFFSSTGQVEGNECWGSREGSGIAVRRGRESVEAASDVVVTGNRCHDNRQAGIAFLSSTGRVEGNECWGNRENQLAVSGDPEPRVGQHRTTPTLSGEERLESLIAGKKLRDWLMARDYRDARLLSLAEFLTSAGCPHCFDRFWRREWNDEGQTAIAAAPGSEKPATEDSALYSVERTAVEDGAPFLQVRALAHDEKAKLHIIPSPSGPGDLLPLVRGFAQTGSSSRGKGVRWVVALVSADDVSLDRALSNETLLRRALSAHDSGSPRSPITVVDLGGRQSEPTGGPEWDMTVHLLEGRTRRARLLACFDALLFVPALEGLVALLLVLVTTDAALHVAWPGGAGHSLGSVRAIFGATLPTLPVWHWGSQWGGPTAVASAVFLWLSAVSLVVNRLLPGNLGFSDDDAVLVAETLSERLAKLARRLSHPRRDGATTVLRKLLRSSSCRRHWLVRKVYGRAFGVGRFMWRKVPPAVVVLKHVDVPTESQRREMRALLDLCPRGQSVLFIVQMPGLSMLLSGFLDVWFPPGGNGVPFDVSLVAHDPVSARVPESSEGSVDSTGSVRTIGKILGWQPELDDPSKPDGMWFRNANQMHANSQAEAHFRKPLHPIELLQVMVLGSTPQFHMQLKFRNDRDSNIGEQAKRYLDALDGTSSFDGPDLFDEVNECVENADGLIKVSEGRTGRWVGRVGYRRALAAAILGEFGTKPHERAEASDYLASMLARGEMHHVREAVRLIAESSDPVGRNDRVALHLEAAVFLAEEAQFGRSQRSYPAIEAAWRALIDALATADAPAGLTSIRLCGAVLRRAETVRPRGLEWTLDGERVLVSAALDPFAESESPAVDCWSKAAREVRRVMAVLMLRSSPTSYPILEAYLSQDWRGLPESLKVLLRQTLAASTQQVRSWLGRVTTMHELLQCSARCSEKPGFVVSSLAKMAVARVWRSALDDAERVERLGRLGDGVLRLRSAIGASVPGSAEEARAWNPDPDAISASLAEELLGNDDCLRHLADAFKKGQAQAMTLQSEVGRIRTTLDGVALGVRGMLHGIVTKAEQYDESMLSHSVMHIEDR